MYVKHNEFEPVMYPVDAVYHEVLQTHHIPEKLGPVKLSCVDTELHEGSRIISRLSVLMLRFTFPVEVTEQVENHHLKIEGEDSDARVELLIAFEAAKRQRATRVNVDFNLETYSRLATKAESLLGAKKSDEMARSVFEGMFRGVVSALDNSGSADRRIA